MAVQSYPGNYSRGGKSSVNAFEIKSTTIRIFFLPRKNQSIYRIVYTYKKSVVGAAVFERMADLALIGRGLNKFINRSSPLFSSQTHY